MNGALIVMKKEIKLLLKSKRRFFLLFMMPIIILIIGLISTASIYFIDDTFEPTHIFVIDEQPSAYSNDLITLWSTLNNTELSIISANYSELISSMEFDVLVFIPSNFSSLISNNQTSQIIISYNANETVHQNIAYSILTITELYDGNLVVINYPDVQFNYIEGGLQEIKEQDDENVVDEELAQVLVIIPVYVIFFVVISPISLVLISVTIEREQNTLEVLFLQPVKRRAIVMGKILYGLFLVFVTLFMDIISILLTTLMMNTATASVTDENTDFDFSGFTDFIGMEEIIMFFLGIVAVAIIIIALSVLLSLLSKDEKEANMISGIIPMLIMGMAVLIFVLPIAEMSIVGQGLLAITPILGIIVSIFLSTLAGGVVPLAYISILAQALWSILIILATARISEAESILELSYGKAFSELRRAILRKNL
ncbi:MAG: ABC transporter permease [Candidatus Heimdallarchaeota archaeon]|nr:ABC transporter permease [Candidatus Heimdallarchaeota archaeon]